MTSQYATRDSNYMAMMDRQLLGDLVIDLILCIQLRRIKFCGSIPNYLRSGRFWQELKFGPVQQLVFNQGMKWWLAEPGNLPSRPKPHLSGYPMP